MARRTVAKNRHRDRDLRPTPTGRARVPWTRILVAVDDSDTSRRAVRLAARFAAMLGANLTIVHVVTWEPMGREPKRLVMREMQAELDQAALVLLEKMKAEAASAGVKADIKLLHGKAAESVNRLAADRKHDLILIGVRGRNAISRLLLGSVADRIIRTATRPVLVVR